MSRVALRGAAYACLVLLAFSAAVPALAVVSGARVAVVTGGSMEPAVPLGAAVLLRPARSYEPGTVVTYAGAGGTLTTHRVVAVRDGGAQLVTRGDANAQPDSSAVPVSAVRGSVRAHLPYMGYLLAAATSGPGRLVLLGVPLLLLLLDQAPVLLAHGGVRTVLRRCSGRRNRVRDGRAQSTIQTKLPPARVPDAASGRSSGSPVVIRTPTA